MDTKILKIIEVNKNYEYQGPRFEEIGPNSGEEFLEKYFIPWLKELNPEESGVVDFAGTISFNPSFLEETFGGAIRAGFRNIKNIQLENIPEYWKLKTEKYIKDALRLNK